MPSGARENLRREIELRRGHSRKQAYIVSAFSGDTQQTVESPVGLGNDSIVRVGIVAVAFQVGDE